MGFGEILCFSWLLVDFGGVWWSCGSFLHVLVGFDGFLQGFDVFSQVRIGAFREVLWVRSCIRPCLRSCDYSGGCAVRSVATVEGPVARHFAGAALGRLHRSRRRSVVPSVVPPPPLG